MKINHMTAIFSFKSDVREWSTSRIIDELNLSLIKVLGSDGCTRKYENHARWLLYRIPIYLPMPYFIISLRDLNTKLKKQLASLDRRTLEYVMKEGVGRIFEGLDYNSRNYFLIRVRPLLKVGLVD